MKEKQVYLNTKNYAVKVSENKKGVTVDVFHRHGELINTHTYLDGNTCKYCGNDNGSDDEDILCKDCRYDFGHTLYSEL